MQQISWFDPGYPRICLYLDNSIIIQTHPLSRRTWHLLRREKMPATGFSLPHERPPPRDRPPLRERAAVAVAGPQHASLDRWGRVRAVAGALSWREYYSTWINDQVKAIVGVAGWPRSRRQPKKLSDWHALYGLVWSAFWELPTQQCRDDDKISIMRWCHCLYFLKKCLF